MLELQAEGGFGGATKLYFERHRTAIVSAALCFLGIAMGTGTMLGLLQSRALLDPALIGAGVLLAAGCCALQTRHVPLALLAAGVPLPGLIWAAPLSGGASFGFVPFGAYAFAFAVATLLAQSVVDRALTGAKIDYPWRPVGAAVVLMFALGFLWFWRTPATDASFQAVVDILLATGSAVVLLPGGVHLLHFDESFVARANRERERRQRALERIASVAGPRWGMSFTGIALILLALAWFGAAPFTTTLHTSTIFLGLLSAALFVAIATGVAGDWREGLATGLVAGLVCLMGLWAIAVGRNSVSFVFVGCLEAVALAALLAFCGGRNAWAFRRRGEEPVVARQRAIEEFGVGQVFAGAGALLAVLPGLIGHPAFAECAIPLLLAAVGGTVMAPAAAATAEVAQPRRRSVEEMYGTRKRRPSISVPASGTRR